MFEVDFHILNQKSTPAIYADDLANRPAFGFAGRIFINTVTPYGVYRDTGTSWVQIASNGGGGGGSTGINGLNGTTNIGLGGTLENNTSIDADSFKFQMYDVDEFDIQTSGSTNTTILNNSLGINLQVTEPSSSLVSTFFIQKNKITTGVGVSLYGLNCDFVNQIFGLGDYTNTSGKKNSIIVDDTNSKIYFTTSNSLAKTDPDLLLASITSATDRYIKLGAVASYDSAICLEINPGVNNNYVKTSLGSNIYYGLSLKLDTINTEYICDLGDFDGENTYVNFKVNATGQNISTQFQDSITLGAVTSGLLLDWNNNKTFKFGYFNDSSGIENYLLCTNSDLALNCGSDKLSINGNIITSPEAIPISAMIVYVNGTRYKINLY